MTDKKNKEIEFLARAAGVLDDASITLGGLAAGDVFDGDVFDVGTQKHTRELVAFLREEARRYRVQARGVYQIQHENEDNANPDSGIEPVRPLQIKHLIYDQRAVQDRGADNIKWYNPHTDLGDRTGSTRRTRKRGICVHHTAVRGGFGTHSSRRDAWLAYARANPDTLYEPSVVQPNGDAVLTAWPIWNDAAFATEESWAEHMALADRYRGYVSSEYNTGVPYHVIRTASGVLIYNLPWEWVTWHGDGSNTDFLGFAWDGDSRYDTFEAEDAYEDLLQVVSDMRADNHPVEELTGHCAWTRKPDDPGKAMVEVMAQVASDEGLTINWDFKVSGGRSLREVLDA